MKGRQIRCECGHHKSAHYRNRKGCHAIDVRTGRSLDCKCQRDQFDVEREAVATMPGPGRE